MIAAVSAHFNFDPSYFKPITNLDVVAATWKKTMELQVAEACFMDRAPEFSAAKLHVPVTSVLWHKESLINEMVKRLPADVDKVIVTDADITWERGFEWMDHVDALLEHVPVVQLWTKMNEPDERGVVQGVSWSRGSRPIEQGYFGAMAFHREFFEFCGLYDRLITGPNDAVLTGGIEGFSTRLPIIRQLQDNEWLAKDVEQWMRKAHRYFRGDIQVLNREVRHLWHGSKGNRNYEERNKLLLQMKEDDLERTHEGMWSFTKPTGEFATAVEEFFYPGYRH